MTAHARILLIEDDAGIAASLGGVLRDEGYELTLAERGDEGLKLGRARAFDVMLTDLKLPSVNGLDLVRELHKARPRVPIILMTAYGTTETAIEAMKLGAFEYLLKPFEMAEMLDVLAKAVASSRMMSEPVELGEVAGVRDAIVGCSRAMQAIYKEIGRVASKPVIVLIRGETGTGKELIARAIYQHSGRANAPFIAVNCAAIPETLLESELFGHERGAFTGAEARRIGRFEQADGGTIFLDEIGDLSATTQSKLLRVLQERTIQRLGGREDIRIDLRVIAATHQPLEQMIRERKFREDLFYRLNVASIQLPPLRERAEDISELVHYFLARYGGELGGGQAAILPEALDVLKTQPWPGNVRELENVVRKLLLLARGFAINAEHVRLVLAPATATKAEGQSLRELVAALLTAAQRGEMEDAHGRALVEVEQEIFSQAIELAQGNQARAARWLGVSRITMREKLRQFGLHPARNDTEAE